MATTMATTMRMILTRAYDDHNDNEDDDDEQPCFLGNNQPWSDAFLPEGWWVISMMMTMMRMTTVATTMRTFLTRTYDDNNHNDNDSNKQPRFLGNNQPWLDAFLAEGWWVIFMMITKMRMTTMATTMRRTIALASFRRCYQCSQRQCRQRGQQQQLHVMT